MTDYSFQSSEIDTGLGKITIITKKNKTRGKLTEQALALSPDTEYAVFFSLNLFHKVVSRYK